MTALLLLLALLAVGAAPPGARADDEEDEADSFDLLGYYPTTELARRLKPFQVRASVMFGALNLSSRNSLSYYEVSLNGVQAGSRFEIERWFQSGRANRRKFGIVTDLQYLYAGRFGTLPGPPVSYASVSSSLGWRVLGSGESQPWFPNLEVYAGPAIEIFPSMSVLPNKRGYDLHYPLVLGLKGGARLRLPLIPESQRLSAEVQGYTIYPAQLLGGNKGASIDRTQTHSLGATALLDFRVVKNLTFGAGIYWGYYQVNYTLPNAYTSDRTTYYTRSFITSLRWNF